MKFLCVACDTAMKLDRTLTPQGGALTVVFSCPACGRETALLTNPMETQMVRSLGVEIGGRTAAPEPMSLVRRSLVGQEAAGPTSAPADPSAHPLSGERESPSPAARIPGSEGKCPFSGVVSEAFSETAAPIPWTPAARERIDRIPAFAQPMVKIGVEMHARQNGVTEITEAVIDQVKARFGM